MRTHGVVVVFLYHDHQWLLMKRAPDREHYPNVWDGVGGGIQAHEYTEPDRALLRELYEETGIPEQHVFELKLKYLHINVQQEDLSLHYVYFARTDQTDVRQTEEGVLSWIPAAAFLQREFSPAMAALLRHYVSEGQHTADQYLFSTCNGVHTITPFETE